MEVFSGMAENEQSAVLFTLGDGRVISGLGVTFDSGEPGDSDIQIHPVGSVGAAPPLSIEEGGAYIAFTVTNTGNASIDSKPEIGFIHNPANVWKSKTCGITWIEDEAGPMSSEIAFSYSYAYAGTMAVSINPASSYNTLLEFSVGSP
jgi:hypothetical protein